MYHDILQILARNSAWMQWNLFLALIPLLLSFYLFNPTASSTLRWGTGFLTGMLGILSFSSIASISLALLRQGSILYLLFAVLLVSGIAGMDALCFPGRSRSTLWWFGCIVFILFLPNAPYLLTDIIHLIEDIRQTRSIWVLTLFAIPLYIVVLSLGFAAYTVSLVNLSSYLKVQKLSRWILPSEWTIHLLSAIGICLGRFERFNSWDLFTHPRLVIRQLLTYFTNPYDWLIIGISFLILMGLYSLTKFLINSVAIAHQVRVME
ncbi:MAG: DUF1361 domain-containing protein [Phormidium sp. GEM2.Bin31]|nr:MAG: DUF1361 domain-containing protein [Phormidium sp. GEM2.Bin31]